MDAPLWRLSDVRMPGRAGPRLDRVTVEIPSGATAVLGPSGAGKTTLLNLLVGFERPQSGTITRVVPGTSGSGEPPTETESPTLRNSPNRLDVFWVPPGHGLWPHLTVEKHLATIMDPGRPSDVNDLLGDFELEPLARAYPATLSQGERDRLALARAIAADPEILILDEPLAHVPDEAADRYWSRLRQIVQARKMSVVFATHDLAVAFREAAHLICLQLGRVTYAGTAEGYRRD